ncbi:tyrosine protein phosphatase 1 [Datura stramonium]|uniref:Tyrosine protein phosphatase 1 n=1 Tax=Datura stramonium TaxID=4076 RepID=A0ABS8SRV7_DATST|nr:tyrosine protein phosphatase 1 [Datura stramonium]
MAAADNLSSSVATSTESPPTSPGTANKPFDFSTDSIPQRIVLSPDQRSYYLEVLKAFKEKRFHSPDKTASEFSILQDIDIYYYPCTFSCFSNTYTTWETY